MCKADSPRNIVLLSNFMIVNLVIFNATYKGPIKATGSLLFKHVISKLKQKRMKTNSVMFLCNEFINLNVCMYEYESTYVGNKEISSSN